jgi:hypothetical protein
MSFASGYNAGMNLTAQLRADSRARRQEERQMVLDEKAEERARVKDEIDNLQIMSLKTKMETEKKIRERVDLQRAESRIALGKFVEESRKLNPDDLDGYADIYAKYRPLVTDPEVAKSFQNVYSVHAANYKDRQGTLGFMKKEIEEKENAQLLVDMKKYGLSADPSTPKGRDDLMGFKRWQLASDMIKDSSSTWESTGVSGTSYSLTPEQLGQVEQSTNKRASELEETASFSPKERQMIRARKQFNDQPEDSNLYQRLEATGKIGAELSQSEVDRVDDSMLAMELLEDSAKAMSFLGIKTGKGFGAFSSTVMELAQQDQSITDFKASVQRLIPKLARGVYGEVGVLTDPDIENYKKTVASIGQTEDANKMVMAQTQALISRGMRNKLEQLGKQGYNVSMYSQRLKTYADSPTVVYRSVDDSRQNLYQDIKRNLVRPGEKIYIWDGEKFQTSRAKPLSEY